MAPRDWRARTQEALSPRARRAPCESVEQIRPVNARGGSGVAQTRALRAPEAERIAGICGSRAGVLASKRATHLHLGCSNAHGSPHVGRHLRSEGSDVSVAELRNRDGKHKLCVHPPIFAVPSQRNAHHFQSSSLSEQADNGERFRSLSEPRRQRGKADPPRSARSAKVPPHHLQSASRQRPGQRRARRLGGPHGSGEKTNDLSVPTPPLTPPLSRVGCVSLLYYYW